MLLFLVSYVSWVYWVRRGGTLIVLPCPPGEDLKESQVACILGGCVGVAEGLDGWGGEEFGEYVGVRVGGCVCD